MKLYRLFTENKKKKFIIDFISDYFTGFTIFETTGVWQGIRERSLCIEIMSDSPAAHVHIDRICKAICGYNKQQCVLVQTMDVQSQFIG